MEVFRLKKRDLAVEWQQVGRLAGRCRVEGLADANTGYPEGGHCKDRSTSVVCRCVPLELYDDLILAMKV